MTVQKPNLGNVSTNSGGVANTPNVTTNAGGVAGVTPTNGSQPDDAANVSLEQLQAQLQQAQSLNTSLQGDINNMKSTFQRQMSQREKEWEQQQKQMREEFRTFKLQTAPEEERPQLEQQFANQQLQDVQAENERLARELQERDQKYGYYQTFSSLGISVDFDQPLNDLVNQGWTGLVNTITELRAQLAAVQQGQQPANPQQFTPQPQQPVAPNVQQTNVLTQQPQSYDMRTTWPELIQKYGSEEEVYRLVELGSLPASIIPLG